MEKTFTYDGTKYTLTYTLDSVRRMENNGFILEEIETKPATAIPQLFAGALIAKHKYLTADKINELWKALPGKSKLITELIRMYSNTVQQVIDEPDDEKNAATEVNW